MPPDSARPGRSTLRLVLVNAGILVLLLAVLEAAVRVRAVLKYGFAGGVEDILAVDDATGLRVPVAGRTLGPIAINSLGFRGPGIPREKPPGTIRVAFLGGSTTFCAEVSGNEAAWPHLVWQRLQAEFPGASFDYVNAGVPGYGLDAILRNLRERVAPLAPDVIVIYEATNDLSGNSFVLAREQGVIGQRPDKERSWLSRYSLLVYLVEVNLNVAQNQEAAKTATRKLALDLPRLEAPFRAELGELVAAAQAVAPVVAVATFATQFRPGQPEAQQLAAAGTSLYYMPYMSMEGLLAGFAAYNGVIREVARERGALLVEAADAVPGDAAHFRDAVHFTDRGSAAMARAVGDALVAAPALRALAGAGGSAAPPAGAPARGEGTGATAP
jgi:lysophospholipase L1-like esterase